MNRPLMLSAALLLCGCASTGNWLGPAEAIMGAAEAEPMRVPGVFQTRVAATGRQNGQVFVNF